MKRTIRILLVILILVLSTAVFIKPLVILIAKRQLKKTFTGSSITIQNCGVKLLKKFSIFGIDIKKRNAYDIRIKEAGFEYNPTSIINRQISKFYLKNPSVTVNLGRKNILDSSKKLSFSSPALFTPLEKVNPIRKRSSLMGFTINTLEVSDLHLNFNSNLLRVELNLSAGVNLPKQSINYLNGSIVSLKGLGFSLNGASLKVCQGHYPGTLGIDNLKYNKLFIRNIKSKAKLKDNFLSFSSLSADVLEGKLRGDLNLKLRRNIEYIFRLEVIGLNLSKFVSDFKFNENVEISGKMNGNVTLKGNSAGITFLRGDFDTAVPGGTLTIKNNDYLKKLAANANQPLNIVVESFRNYRYNRGKIKIGLKEKNLILDTIMEGEAGRRNFNIILHGFKIRR